MNKDQIMEAIENMTVLELSELVKAMEEKFNEIQATTKIPLLRLWPWLLLALLRQKALQLLRRPNSTLC